MVRSDDFVMEKEEEEVGKWVRGRRWWCAVVGVVAQQWWVEAIRVEPKQRKVMEGRRCIVVGGVRGGWVGLVVAAVNKRRCSNG